MPPSPNVETTLIAARERGSTNGTDRAIGATSRSCKGSRSGADRLRASPQVRVDRDPARLFRQHQSDHYDEFDGDVSPDRKRRLRPIRKDLKGRIATRWRSGLQSVDQRVANR